MTATQLEIPPDRAWFAHWFCHCSMLAATSEECPATCPTHGSVQMHPPEWVDLGPNHYPFGLYVHEEPSR